MKRQEQDKSCRSQHTATLESFWLKKQKTNETSSTTSTNSENSSVTVIIIEAQTASTSSNSEECSTTLIEPRTEPTALLSDQQQSVASSNVTLCDISISSDHPPVQPILSSYSLNEDNRCFQRQWYCDCPWLEYSITNDVAYCYNCHHFLKLHWRLNSSRRTRASTSTTPADAG